MRTIKFRGKSNQPESWRYGTFVYGSLITRGNLDPLINVDDNNLPVDVIVDPKTVGQFTGVYDKNGKEVYEGDIVDCWSEGRHCTNGIVKWMQNRIWIASTWDIWNLMPNKNGIDEGLIVVGNIYDNP